MDWPPAHPARLRSGGTAIIVLALGLAGHLLLWAPTERQPMGSGAGDEELQQAADLEGGSGVTTDAGTSGPKTPEGPTLSVDEAGVTESSISTTAPSTVTSTSGSTTTTSSTITTTSTAGSSTSSLTSTTLTTEANTRPAAGYADPMTASGPAGTGCNTGASNIPDGVWFGFTGGWTNPSIGFDVVCLYGGEAARSRADERYETMRPGRVWYAIDDDGYNAETITVATNARAAEIIDLDGNAGPSVPWADAITRLDLLDGIRATMAWVHIKDWLVAEASVAP